MEFGQGAKMALPIWGLYMQKVYANKRAAGIIKDRFDGPPDLISDSIGIDTMDVR
jgi:penicillin-binding protein 1A